MATSFKNANVVVGTSATTLYTAPAATDSVMFSLVIANKHATLSRTVKIELFDASATTTYVLIQDTNIPAMDAFTWPEKITLEAGDILKLTASAVTDLEATSSIMEKT